jgi:hypothetical protein
MPLSGADLPRVLAAARSFREVVEASPRDCHSKEAHEHAPAVLRAEDTLRRTLTPSNPNWVGGQNEDLYDPDLAPNIVQLLNEVWNTILRDIHRLPPPFAPDQRRAWLVLLETAEGLLAPKEPTRPPTGQFDREDEWLLRALAENPRRLFTIKALRTATRRRVSEKVIGQRLKALIEDGLVVRPKGPKQGAGISGAGKRLIEELPREE